VEGFPFVHHEVARFSDLDGMGHVNNAVYLTYIEQARLAWFGRYADDEPMPLRDVILARTEIDFRSQVVFGETVAIGVRPTRVGTKSFELEYENARRRPAGRRGDERAVRLRLRVRAQHRGARALAPPAPARRYDCVGVLRTP
jgi:acyl-CoA thioester hydrolase